MSIVFEGMEYYTCRILVLFYTMTVDIYSIDIKFDGTNFYFYWKANVF